MPSVYFDEEIHLTSRQLERKSPMTHLLSRLPGMLLLASMFTACTSVRPTPAPVLPITIPTSLTPTREQAPTLSATGTRFGTIQLEPVQNSGISGTITARDNGNGTTTLDVRLGQAAEFNPWGIYALADCQNGLAVDQKPIFMLPDIEAGHKVETVETAAYMSFAGPLSVIIYGIEADGSQQVIACARLGPPAAGADTVAQATPTPPPDCTTPNIKPPQGTWLAFSATRNSNTDIYLLDLEAARQDAEQAVKRLTTHPTSDFDPTWSPDGTQIAFRSQRDGNDEIYLMNADGTCQINLTNDPANDWSPSWSPDGTRLAFAHFFDDKSFTDIVVINVDGSGFKRLTTAHGEYPAWSPDGTRIAFASARDGNYEIYVMNADGMNQTRLTNNPAYDMSPVWSPDGTRIAFDTQRDFFPPREVGIGPEFEIHIINADGSGDIRLTNNTEEDRFPAWDPNMTIAFTRNGILFMVSPDGSEQTQLFDSGSFPAWRPAVGLTAPAVEPTIPPR